MTTKPRARRFLMRLGDEAGAAPAVAPLRGPGPPAPPRPAPPRQTMPGRPVAPPPASAPALADEGEAPVAVAPAPRVTPAQGTAVLAQAAAAQAAAAPPRVAQPVAAAPAAAQAAPAPAPPPQAPQAAAPRPAPVEHTADLEGTPSAEAEIEAIRAEQLTGRQLRMAQRIAQKNGIRAATGLDAVRLLRRQGIDPFKLDTILDIAEAGAAQPDGGSRALTTTEPAPLPKTQREGKRAQAAPAPSAEARGREIKRIQRDIARRRRRRLALLMARLFVFVFLPTAAAAWYFYAVATPLYATNSEFVIQQADSAQPAAPGGLGAMFAGTGLATQQDSVTVQSFLQSREAMRRLDAEHGFKAYFQRPEIDALRRLAPDATDEAAYRLYQRMVQISYDPTEGIIRMEVIAADPETSERFARALVAYAEEQVDNLTQRLRANQMRDATASVEAAEERSRAAQMRVLELQERFQVLSSEVEVTLLTQQITTLEGQLNQERLSLADLRANPRPNAARLAQTERRIATLEGQIGDLRGQLTRGSGQGLSVARVQRELVMAEAEVETRQLLLAQSMQQMELARMEANRQVRYLSMGVSPIAPDEATYPRAFENTALAFLIFGGIYLMLSMTAAILREQVTS